MMIASIIGKSFHNCVKTVKNLGKYLALIIAALFVMQALGGIFGLIGDALGIHVSITKKWMEAIVGLVWWGVSLYIAFEVFVLLGIFPRDDYSYSAARQKEESKYDDIPSWANGASWMLSLAGMAITLIICVYFYKYDDYIGRLTMIATKFVSHQAGTGFALTFVGMVLYGGAMICTLSCLSLLIPVVKYIRRRGFDVFSISGIVSILFYSSHVINDRAGFLINYIGRSIRWQFENTIGYMNYWGNYDGTSPYYVLEHEFILPIIITLIFNGIVYYILNRSVKAFGNNLYNVVSENRHLIEGTVEPMDDHFKEQKRIVDPEHDDTFASLVWTAYSLPMTGWELKQQYTRLGNALNDYAPSKIALYTDDDIQRIKKSGSIIHSDNRIRSVISNAQVYCKIVNEYGSFYSYVRQLIKDDDQTMYSNLRRGKVSLYAKLLAADLHYRGFKYIGPAKASEFLKNNYKMLIK